MDVCKEKKNSQQTETKSQRRHQYSFLVRIIRQEKGKREERERDSIFTTAVSDSLLTGVIGCQEESPLAFIPSGLQEENKTYTRRGQGMSSLR